MKIGVKLTNNLETIWITGRDLDADMQKGIG